MELGQLLLHYYQKQSNMLWGSKGRTIYYSEDLGDYFYSEKRETIRIYKAHIEIGRLNVLLPMKNNKFFFGWSIVAWLLQKRHQNEGCVQYV